MISPWSVDLQVPGDLARAVRRALDEDLGSGDITTGAVVEPAARGAARFVAREPLVLCGLPVMAEVFGQLDPELIITPLRREGDRICPGEAVARIEGPLGPMLTGERVALNFGQRLSGIATLTRSYVDRIGSATVRLVDTRKTTPGIRSLEKYAVRAGGGSNHRFGLSDGVMIKDNHIAAAGGIRPAVERALARVHHLVAVQVEVEDLAQAVEAVEAGARVLLLDNFDLAELRRVVGILRGRTEDLVLEASGGVSLDTVGDIARVGVDLISCGALIHQARWVDLALDM